MQEIERKFLVDKNIWKTVTPYESFEIYQGYLKKGKDLTVRVRTKGNKGYLTIKGATKGISREEFEYEIPVEEAKTMLNTMCSKYIHKTRHIIVNAEMTWEVDEFYGKLEGLILAEIELEDENQSFEKPKWAEKEVSSDPNYFNAVLIDQC